MTHCVMSGPIHVTEMERNRISALVVIIIIGVVVLAAMALPSFLGQAPSG